VFSIFVCLVSACTMQAKLFGFAVFADGHPVAGAKWAKEWDGSSMARKDARPTGWRFLTIGGPERGCFA
jgi:hypothetical protein